MAERRNTDDHGGGAQKEREIFFGACTQGGLPLPGLWTLSRCHFLTHPSDTLKKFGDETETKIF
jgi:hypothetical protein